MNNILSSISGGQTSEGESFHFDQIAFYALRVGHMRLSTDISGTDLSLIDISKMALLCKNGADFQPRH